VLVLVRVVVEGVGAVSVVEVVVVVVVVQVFIISYMGGGDYLHRDVSIRRI